MRLASLKDGQKRDRHLSIFFKQVVDAFRSPRESRAILVFGNQRSGTSMLMYAFHRHPKIRVYDEHRNNAAFSNYRIRNFAVINAVVRQSSFPAVCFKPICDSHLISEFSVNLPGAHLIWIYRDFRDVANSSLRKFNAATRAITLVCEGKTGGGWFQEGLSEDMSSTLQEVYANNNLSSFDLCCLVWWARNRALLESGMIGSSNLSVIKYEILVTRPHLVMHHLFQRMDFPFDARVTKRLSPRSIGRDPYPAMNTEVENLCNDVMQILDDSFDRNFLEL